ncbi:sensor histidine kinase [Streptomyces otsuchiensis]|uniref:sensor histidine kinase n=1 Tax=Streptomyces otsuchiensis TaxID=2681388 RepID=UPI001477854B|nr:sensor histidine kinase [Streptomyces otsuchiensis]
MPLTLPRVLRRDPVMTVVVALSVVDTAVMLAAMPYPEPLWQTALCRLLVLLGALAFVWRERRPVTVALFLAVATALYYPLGDQDGPLMMALYALALFYVAYSGRLVSAAVIALATLAAAAWSESVTRARGEGNIDDMAFVLLLGWVVGVLAFGHALRVRREYLREAERRALAAEGERDARARQAATEERLRIAREIHDVVGHHLSLINVRSAAALHRRARRPEETAELADALEAVRDTSREALRELRATLGVLRQVDEAAPVNPAPGLDRVGPLVERLRATTGLAVRLTTAGTPVALPPPISLAAHRIVQEALTNVTRHSDANSVEVKVGYAPGGLRLTVADDGAGTPDPGGEGEVPRGSGVAGMTERARALGGGLTAGRPPGGAGFVVDAGAVSF